MPITIALLCTVYEYTKKHCQAEYWSNYAKEVDLDPKKIAAHFRDVYSGIDTISEMYKTFFGKDGDFGKTMNNLKPGLLNEILELLSNRFMPD